VRCWLAPESGRGKRAAKVGAIGRRLLRHEITANPSPERLERRTRNTALSLVGAVVDQEEFNRLEKVAGHMVTAGSRLAGFAQDAAQFIEESLAARNPLAASRGVLEPWNQKSTRRRLELLEVFLQSLDGQTTWGHAATHEFMKANSLDSAPGVTKPLSNICGFSRRYGEIAQDYQLTATQAPSGLRQAVPRAISGRPLM
jgi:hypothetical protein